MSILIGVISLAIGLAIGLRLRPSNPESAHGLAAEKARCEELNRCLDVVTGERDALRKDLDEHRERSAALGAQAQADRRRIDELIADEGRLELQFQKISADMLRTTNETLVKTADQVLRSSQEVANKELEAKHLEINTMLDPIKENLNNIQRHVTDTTKERKEEWGALAEQLRSVAATNERVERKAAELTNVMTNSSAVRGRWGEHQLRRLFDMAGMVEDVDYIEQLTVSNDEKRSRADFVVLLPNDIKIAVDSKAPFESYQAAINSEDKTEQKRLFDAHALALKTAVDGLVQRRYWESYAPSLGFCVLFVAGDSTLQAALEAKPELWEYAMTRNVMLASPSTIIAMLRVASETWRQQRQADNAALIANEGKKLYDRLCKVFEHLAKVGKSLDNTVRSYNELVGSHERMVIPAARSLAKLGAATTKQIEEPVEVSRFAKDVTMASLPQHAIIELPRTEEKTA